MKKNYYICVGLRNLVTKGELEGMFPTLPLDQEIHLDNIEFIMGEENINVEDEIQDLKDKMEDWDSLTIRYWNEDAPFILEEWIDEFNIPPYQREEIWTTQGLVQTYLYFINAEDENWHWLTDAQVDYYDDDGNPVPVYPEDLEDED
tara:strand:+ start:954 stop:1394 length:441 start_codon:yes stop_codon:yes gene_type:complete